MPNTYRTDTPATVAPEMIATFREYQVHRTGPYRYRYVGGPADGLRICHEQRGSRTLMGWHFGARDGSWMAYYTWSDQQRAYVFLGWEAINRHTHPGERVPSLELASREPHSEDRHQRDAERGEK